MSSLPVGGREQRKSHPSKRNALEAIKSEGERDLKQNEEELSPKRARRCDLNGDEEVRRSPEAVVDSALSPASPKNEASPSPAYPPSGATPPVSNPSNSNGQYQPPAAVPTSGGFPHLLAGGPLFGGGSHTNGQSGGGAMPTQQHPVFPFHPPLLDPATLQSFFASHGLPFPHPPPPPFGGIYPSTPVAGLRPDALGPMNYYLESAAAAGFHPYGPHMDPGRRKNATREVTLPLKNWLNEHRKNPYPTKAEKTILAIVSKMTMTQVSTWFANARRRLKKENKMTWSPRNRTADDDDDDEDDGDAARGGEDGNERPSSSTSALSVEEHRKITPLLGTAAAMGTPLNGFNPRLEGSFNSSGGSTSALETPRKKGTIWSIADTLLTDGKGDASGGTQMGTSASSSSSNSSATEKPRVESATGHNHNNSVVDLSTRAAQSHDSSHYSKPSAAPDVGFPAQMMMAHGMHQQLSSANPMVEAFTAAFTAFMNGASTTMAPNSTSVMPGHSPAAVGLSAFMMPHLMAAGMVGAAPLQAPKISPAALAASHNPLLALMAHQSQQHQLCSANQSASHQQHMVAVMAAMAAQQQYGGLRQLNGGSVAIDCTPAAHPPVSSTASSSKPNGTASTRDVSMPGNGCPMAGPMMEKKGDESFAAIPPHRAASPKQQCSRKRRDASKIYSPASNS